MAAASKVQSAHVQREACPRTPSPRLPVNGSFVAPNTTKTTITQNEGEVREAHTRKALPEA